jgi:hypothetical protein
MEILIHAFLFLKLDFSIEISIDTKLVIPMDIWKSSIEISIEISITFY